MKRVLLKGPIFSQSGYGHHARTIFRALRKHQHIFDIYIIPTPWGHTNWIWEDNEERRFIDALIGKTQMFIQQGGQFDIFLHCTVPNEFEKLAPVSIGMTAGIETTKLPPEWIEPSLKMDKIIVVSNHAKTAFDNTTYLAQDQTGRQFPIKVDRPVEVVNYPVRLFEPKVPELELEHDFNFLYISQWSPRKNFENTIKWFVEEFKDKKVGLIVKTNIAANCLIDREVTKERIQTLLSQLPQDRKCSIHLLHGDISDEEMTGIYRHPKVKALINFAYGEGFGLPMFEAVYNGLPVIAPAWGGQNDFIFMPVRDKKTKKEKMTCMITQVGYDLKFVDKEHIWPGFITPDSMWAFVKEFDAKAKMREIHKDYGTALNKAKKLQKHVLDKFEENVIYKQLVDAIYTPSEIDERAVDISQFINSQMINEKHQEVENFD